LVPRRHISPPRRHQQPADQHVVGDGQRSDHILQHARSDHHDDAEPGHVEPVVADMVVLAARLDVLLA
jgi:hypothetical protein